MSERVDLLIHNSAQVLVVPSIDGGPQRGADLGRLGAIEHGAVAIREGRIVAAGAEAELRARYEPADLLDAGGCAITPGFVDPHTHLAWTGDRAQEFEMRIAGATYLEILQAGGGILNTVRQVRAATVEEIVVQTRARLDRMLRHGSTSVEIKTGYGLDTASELKLLEAIWRLQDEHPADIAVTFLGAHAVPPEYSGRTEAYVGLLVEEAIPAAAEAARQRNRPLPFADVFCESGVFDLAQTRRILEAARTLGMPLKVHVDEFAALGGARLAAELGAASADHLVVTPPEDIQVLGRSNTVAVALPLTPFGLGQTHYTPAREILAANGILALATDCNPGTAWCESMALVVALACRAMRITPAQALAAATLNAAYAAGLAGRTGSLEPGKQADLLILETPDYRHLAYRFGTNLVRTVLKRGRIVAG